MKPFFIFLTSFLLLNFSCKEDPTKNAVLPPATQEGKNTIGFTINGEVWVPYAKCVLDKIHVVSILQDMEYQVVQRRMELTFNLHV